MKTLKSILLLAVFTVMTISYQQPIAASNYRTAECAAPDSFAGQVSAPLAEMLSKYREAFALQKQLIEEYRAQLAECRNDLQWYKDGNLRFTNGSISFISQASAQSDSSLTGSEGGGWFKKNWEATAALLFAIYTFIVRVIPTGGNWDILSKILSVIVVIIPNNKKGGGTHD